MESVQTVPSIDSSLGALWSLEVAVALRYALSLDELWTTELEKATTRDASEIDRGELDAILTIGESLVAAADRLSEPVQRFRELLNAADDATVDDALRIVVNGSNEGREIYDMLRTELLAEELGGYELRGAGIEACDYVLYCTTEAEEREQDVLRGKLERLQDGTLEPGDFRFPFRCAGYVIETCGWIALTAATATVFTPAVAGGTLIVLGAVRGWKDSGCKNAWKDITGGRR